MKVIVCGAGQVGFHGLPDRDSCVLWGVGQVHPRLHVDLHVGHAGADGVQSGGFGHLPQLCDVHGAGV